MNVTIGTSSTSKLQEQFRRARMKLKNELPGEAVTRLAVRVSCRLEGDVAILSLSGKFVAGTDGVVLRQRVRDLIDTGTRKLLFNFAEVPYIDSTGLGFLAGSRELALEAGAVIVLAGMNPHVRRILDGVKLSQFFDLAEDEKRGLALIEQLASKRPEAAPAGQVPDRRSSNNRGPSTKASKPEGGKAAGAKLRAAEE